MVTDPSAGKTAKTRGQKRFDSIELGLGRAAGCGGKDTLDNDPPIVDGHCLVMVIGTSTGAGESLRLKWKA